MSSSLRRGALAASALAFSVATLAGCAAGNNAQTLEVKPDNAATTVGDIKLQNVVVITPSELESTGPAAVSATVFNTGDTAQTLESITVPGTGKTAELKPAEGKDLSIPAGGSLVIGGKNNASAVLPSSREAIQDGNAQKITFVFSKTGDVSLRAFVVPAEGFYASWGATEVPETPADVAASPSASTSGEPATSASPSTSEEAGAPADGASPSTSATTGQ
ncbi:copper chaperone PCu(A)C [Streptomyces sp. SID12501]|uniref:Copper chaperone PCu(A)C n=1 Tax=Streptomyces sp. SID12501 TaxID=2706042 RepID=A0A6B3BY78_9ACTN|nr:copper chaperone PCu(A)C [Streptomyces sp. SID12501]